MIATALVATMLALALWETTAPAQALRQPPQARWVAGLGLFVINIGVAYWLIPVLRPAPAASVFVGNWLLFGVVASVLLLDLLQYVVHRLFHRFPLLWRVHRVHHSDGDVDLATGFRHHPIESVLTQVVVGAAVALSRLPVEGYLAYAVMAQVSNFYTHANIGLGARADAGFRLIFVSPAMHRVHHAVGAELHDRNFATIFSFWDRLFGTYTAPQGPIEVGLPDMSREKPLGLGQLLAMPFR